MTSAHDDATTEPAATSVVRLVGIYDADGGMVGEVRYVVGHLLGRLECSLCDITHGPLRRKRAFDEVRSRLGVPFELVHRNERDRSVVDATGDRLPCVVADAGGRILTVLGPDELRRCEGDVERFEVALREALVAAALHVPDA